jgi:hypothetical protein
MINAKVADFPFGEVEILRGNDGLTELAIKTQSSEPNSPVTNLVLTFTPAEWELLVRTVKEF